MDTRKLRRGAALCLSLGLALSLPLTAYAVQEERAPIARNTNCRTYQNIAVQGELKASASGAEALTYEIVERPKKGTVALQDDADGRFTYTPETGKSGRDHFTFCVRDEAGNRSAPAAVRLEIAKPKAGVSYADMEGEKAHAAAVRLAEEGVFTGRKVGDHYFFDPAAAVSRGEFLAMVMGAAKMDTGDAVRVTGFGDDESIPTWAKSYASKALNEGLVKGKRTADRVVFSADEPISYHEAAVILNRMLAVTDVDTAAFADKDVPVWAVQSVANLTSVQVMRENADGGVWLNRAAAAEMLSAAMDLLERKDGLRHRVHR